MTLPRTSSKTKFWHNACCCYLYFKINKTSRIKKRRFMGSLGTCITKDCFCGEELSTKTQHREKTTSWWNVVLFQTNLLKSWKWVSDVLSYTSSSSKKTPNKQTNKNQKSFSFTALPHWLLDITTQFSLLPVKFNVLCLLYHFCQSRLLLSLSGIYVC